MTEAERLEIIKRHPPPWPFVPYEPSQVPKAVVDRILDEDA